MSLTIIILGSAIWILGWLFYYVYRSKTIHVTVKGDSQKEESVPNINLSIIFEDDKSLDHLVFSDMILNYKDLIEGKYKVPAIVSDVVKGVVPIKEASEPEPEKEPEHPVEEKKKSKAEAEDIQAVTEPIPEQNEEKPQPLSIDKNLKISANDYL